MLGAAEDLDELVKEDFGGEEAALLPWSILEGAGVLMLEVVPIDDEVLVLEEFFLLLLPEINLSPLPLSSPLLRLFLFSLLLPSNFDTSFSSLPRSFSEEPGDLELKFNFKSC